MACIACHKSDQIHSWQMDNREWQIFIDTVTILPPRLYPWYLISHQRMILALFLALRQRQSQNLHGSRRHKSRLCEHKKERQNTKEQDSKPARRVRVLYCPPSSRTKKDIYAKNPEVSTASGFFCAHFLKLEKKISKGVLAKSVDLNLYPRDFGPLFREFFGKAALFCSRQNVEFRPAFLLVIKTEEHGVYRKKQ